MAFYYHLDLRDLWRPGGGLSRLTWRRLKVLVDRLPGESATKTVIRDDIPDAELAAMARKGRGGHGQWSTTDLLLATVIDRLGCLRADLYRAQGGKAEYPPPLPRPGVGSGKVRALNDAGRRYLQLLAGEHAGRLDDDGKAQLARMRQGVAGEGRPNQMT